MTFKALLVPFAGEPGSEAALGMALALGERFNSQIELLHVAIDPITALAGMGEGIAGATASLIIESSQAAADARAEEAHQVAEAACRTAGWVLMAAGEQSTAGHLAIWRQTVGVESEEIASRGRVADLIVVPTPALDEGSAISGLVAGALFETGRPVMVAPEKAPYVVGNKVAVAWNGSREAARTVAAAMPLIIASQQATVIADLDRGGQGPAEDLVEYLALHGVSADIVGIPADSRSIGERLVYAAVTAGADLLVMGAYGHSRLRELMLGGATLGALQHTTIPLFMVH